MQRNKLFRKDIKKHLPNRDYNKIEEQLVTNNLIHLISIIMRLIGFTYAVACILFIISSIEQFYPSDEHTDWTIEFEDKIGE
jgi:hypothetical protein